MAAPDLPDPHKYLPLFHKINTPFKIFPVLLLILSLAVIAYYVRFRQNYQSRAYQNSFAQDKIVRIKTLNSTLRENAGKSLTAQNKSSLKATALERKQIMLSFLPDSPDQFLQYTLSENVIAKLPQELVTENLVETKKIQQGKLTMFVQENLNDQKVKYLYNFNNQKLYIPQNSEPLSGSGQVAVIGYSLDENVVVPSPSINVVYSPLINYQISGPQKTLIVPVSAAWDPISLDPNALNATIFGATNSASTYFIETSRNRINLTGEVSAVVTISNVANRCNPFYDLTDAADAELVRLGYNLADYRLIQYYLPAAAECTWSYNGMAIVGGQKSMVTGNDYVYLDTSTHEIGHSFGLLHANRLYCPNGSLSDLSVCNDIEYGDMFDRMGKPYDGNPQFNAPHKLALGWISPEELLNITQDKQFDLVAHESSASGIKIARIWRNIAPEYLYLSFRQPTGLDSLLPATLVKGTNLHLTHANTDSVRTLFIDAHPDDQGGVGFYDAGIFDNQTYSDPDAGFTIKQLSHTSSKAVLQVNIPENYPPRLTDITYTGLYENPERLLKADLNSPINFFIHGYDYSDAASVSGTVIMPDGSTQNIQSNIISETGTSLCQEIKCFLATAEFIPSRNGIFKLTFQAKDTQGALSNTKIFEFSVGDITITNTPTPRVTLTPTPTLPAVITLETSADAFVNSQYPNNNTGTEPVIRVLGTPLKISFLKFDLTSLAGRTITKATLRLWINDPSGSQINIRTVLDSNWSENTLTYNNMPSTGAIFKSFTAAKPDTYVNIDLTSFVKNNTGKTVSMAFKMTGTNEIRIASKENTSTDSAHRPVLIIQ